MTMQPRTIPTSRDYRITQNDPNVTLSAGTTGSLSDVASFTAPNRTRYVIRANDVFSLKLTNAGGTEVADTSLVELVREDPNGILRDTIVTVDYVTLKEFQDRNKLFTVGQRIELQPEDVLKIRANANIVAASGTTRFQLGSVRVALVRI